MKKPYIDPLTELLTGITSHELAQLLDDHLHDFVQLCAVSGEPLMQEQASAYYHIRRLRDLMRSLEVLHTLNGHG